METYLMTDVSPGLIMTEKHRGRKLAYDVQAINASFQEDWPSLVDILPTMRMPCLVYVGEADAYYPKVRECVRHMPNVTFFSLPNLSHGQAFRYSHQVLPYVKEFLQKVTPSAEQTKDPSPACDQGVQQRKGRHHTRAI
jgi:pimeloyl-ACP methyl ester carboxylesterase